MTAIVSRERARTTALTGAAGLLLLMAAVVMMVVSAPQCRQLTSRSDSTTARACPAPAIPGALLGQRVEHLGGSGRAGRLSGPLPREYVAAFVNFYVGGTLDESQVLPAVREVTGRAPRTFRQSAQAHAGAF